MPKRFTIRSFPNAILHIDGDAFFASCEQALDPSLKGKPVVTGAERGIASAASYEAKRMGVKTGMPIFEVKKICPGAVILPSNYEAYSLFSVRMYEIVRRYTSEVEEYSIDECFADITGLRRSLKMNYREIAARIKEDLDRELGFTFSVGLSLTKVLAKLGSKWQKPNGLTVIPGRDAHLYLEKTAIGKIWGIGAQTEQFLLKKGIKTAYDFALKDEAWVKANLSKPFQEIHYELRGTKVMELETESKETYASISKTKTFSPSSKDPSYVLSELSKNIENACIKLRRHNLRAASAAFFLKTDDFRYRALEVSLLNAANEPLPFIRAAEERFGELWRPGLYRGTGVRMWNITGGGVQLDLFGGRDGEIKYEKIYEAVDDLSEKYGKHTVFLGSSFAAVTGKRLNRRSVKPERFQELLKGENSRKHLNIPIIGEVL